MKRDRAVGVGLVRLSGGILARNWWEICRAGSGRNAKMKISLGRLLLPNRLIYFPRTELSRTENILNLSVK